jgi:cysteine desulfurase
MSPGPPPGSRGFRLRRDPRFCFQPPVAPERKYRFFESMQRIYLDHTATTPMDARVTEAMQPYLSSIFGNASSAHWYGRQAKQALEEARETIARSIGATPGELFFMSGGTESDNHAIHGAFLAARKSGRNRLVTSSAEHHAVLDACLGMADLGAEVSVLPVDEYARASMEDLEMAIDDRTCLVSIMHGNNEVGTLSPVARIAGMARSRGALMHTDAVQTVGKIPLNVSDLDVDLLTFTAHKLYGPKGIGALYLRRGVEIQNLLEGGGQERGRRPGTENVAFAVGFAKAVQIAVEEQDRESRRLAALRDALEVALKDKFPALVVNGHPSDRLPHVLSVSFDRKQMPLEGEMLVANMDLEGIAVSSGSACTSGSIQPSHVLLAAGRDAETAKATLRFSFGRSNSEEDVQSAARALTTVIERMRH